MRRSTLRTARESPRTSTPPSCRFTASRPAAASFSLGERKKQRKEQDDQKTRCSIASETPICPFWSRGEPQTDTFLIHWQIFDMLRDPARSAPLEIHQEDASRFLKKRPRKLSLSSRGCARALLPPSQEGFSARLYVHSRGRRARLIFSKSNPLFHKTLGKEGSFVWKQGRRSSELAQLSSSLLTSPRRSGGSTFVSGLSEYAVRSAQDCVALLKCGEDNREAASSRLWTQREPARKAGFSNFLSLSLSLVRELVRETASSFFPA